MNETHIVLSDFHVPFHDPKALDIAVKVMKDINPKCVHLLGDVLDCYHLSRFDRDPLRMETFQQEAESATEIIGGIKRLSPRGCKIVYTEGNHENRLHRYLCSKAPELASLKCLSIPELLSLRKLGVEYRDAKSPYKIGHLWYTHGNVVRRYSGYTAKAMMDRTGGSVIHGHTHRLGAYHQTDWDRDIAAYENGCLCRLDAEYLEGVPNWQQGFSIVRYRRGYFSVEQVRIFKDMAIVGGEVYR